MAEIVSIRRKTLSNRSTIQVRAISVAESVETFSLHANGECSNPSATDPSRDRPSSLKQI